MGDPDITRHKLTQEFHYTGARMQQGRTLLDSDWNEDAALQAEERRLTLADLVGVQGSSNAGFAISNVALPDGSTTPTLLDFSIHAGSLFVGGLRFVVDPPGESYRGQADWLRREFEEQPLVPTLDELLPDMQSSPSIPGAGSQGISALPPSKLRYDLVYLEAWEQAVTAVEDAELRERALGGPDSSARVRRMRRVKVRTDVGTDNPSDAFAAFVAEFEASGEGTLDPETNELVSGARLTVTAITPASEQPCGPQPPSGYVGHEDEAIRVELRGPTSITWGFGNAAALYRVKVGAGGKKITFLNKPRDARRRPKAGQIVEIIPWGAKLPNAEKLAELSGELFRVEQGYDPGTGELVLKGAVSTGSIQWVNDAREHHNVDDEDDSNYFYLRVWDRGADTSSPPVIDLSEGPVELGKTGLQMSLGGVGRTGDYWLIAARRATPDVVVPWRLLTAEAPFGPRRFLAQLAIIRWEAPASLKTPQQFGALDSAKVFSFAVGTGYAVWGPVMAKVIDGRRRLQPLCIGGCCTITVGDGTTSNGIVNSFADAVAMLPSGGGRICLLPGDHPAEVEIIGRSDIEIYGSGLDCRLVNQAVFAGGESPTDKGTSLLILKDCSAISLKNFAVEAESAIGVEIRGVDSECQRILIEGIEFSQTGTWDGVSIFALPQPAVLALGGDELTVRGCRVIVGNTLSYTGALVLGGQQLKILDNWVQAGDFEAAEVAKSMGGIHVLSRSERVEVAGNVVHGGWGYGIALGHALEWEAAPENPTTITMADIWAAAEDGLGLPVSFQYGYPPDTDAPTGTPASGKGWTPAGHLTYVRLDRNRVTGMGLTGVSTAMMSFGHTDGNGDVFDAFIVILDLEVRRNVMTGNRRITSFSPSDLFAPRADGCCDIAIGGIVISAAIDATFAENRIYENGVDFATPNCGLGFIAMQNLVIRDNYIADNGLEATDVVSEGLRGGIAVMEVTGSLGQDTYLDTIHHNIAVPTQPSIPLSTNKLALAVHGNEVAQRCGKALWVRRAFDDVVVTENNFSSLGDPAPNVGIADSELHYSHNATGGEVTLPAAGACVEVIGVSLAADVSGTHSIMMVNPGAPATTGGNLLFARNSGRLEWSAPGGHAAAYLLSSLDSVIVTDNSLVAVMKSTYAGDYGETFLADIVDDTLPDYSYVLANLYAGAAGSVLCKGNRLTEGEVDAVLSVLIGPALAPADEPTTDLRDAALLRSCVGSHPAARHEPSVGTSVPATLPGTNIIIHAAAGSFVIGHIAGPPKQVTISH